MEKCCASLVTAVRASLQYTVVDEELSKYPVFSMDDGQKQGQSPSFIDLQLSDTATDYQSADSLLQKEKPIAA